MLKKAANLALVYDEIMNNLSQIRLELYDTAEIPHVFDLLLQENLLQTLSNDEQHINNSLDYMKESGQHTLFEETKKNVLFIYKQIEGISHKISATNKLFVKIRKELSCSNTAIAQTLLVQLDCQSHMVNRYFQV